jgi:hypothetical protein
MKIRTEEVTIKMTESAWWIVSDLQFDYITDVYFLIGDVRKKASKFSWSIGTKSLWVYSADAVLEMDKNDISVGDDIKIYVNYMSISEDRNDKLSELVK